MLSAFALRTEPMQSLRRLGSILIVAGPLLGCGELFAPNGGVSIVVEPDSMRIDTRVSPPSVQLNFAIRNFNTYMIAVSPCAPEVEQETSPNVWQTVRPADDCFLEPLPAGTHRNLVAFVSPIAPGRYRISASFAVPDARGISATEKPTLNEFSNVFVVLP